MADFERRSEGELAGLPNEALVAYIAAARGAGDLAAARTASGILAFVFEPTIRAWVRKGMGGSHPQDVEDVVMDVLASAVRSSFDGEVVGEFGSWLKTIAARRVADYFRTLERRSRDESLPEEHEGDDEIWGRGIGTEDGVGAVATNDAIDRVLSTRSGLHVTVIRLYGAGGPDFEDLPADEVCARINVDEGEGTMKPANVHQIWKRFKTDLREELGLDG